MAKDITYVGLDAHQETIHAAALLPGVEKAAEDPFANTPEAIRRWARRLSAARARAGGVLLRGRPAGLRPDAGTRGRWA